MEENKKVNIVFQHFHGCPNSPTLLKRTKEAMKGFKEQINFSEVLIETNELAEKLKFRGSPTLLINNEDFEGMPEPVNSSLTCRYYINGLPEVDEIRKRIEETL